ncbi:MAG: hypothetical protein U5R06_13345 [candidate division KSB1 bacterium]|nr:hypothetical protein [candidate division KSB1 bacterium]
MLNAKSKMFDIVSVNPRMLLVLEHFGVPFGFGNQTVHGLCLANGLNEPLFLFIARLYCCPENTSIKTEQFDHTDAGQILVFLENSHSYFLYEKIPGLQNLLNRKLKDASDKYSVLISKFLQDYSSEVYDHINYENDIVFPYIKALLNGHSEKYEYSIA